MTGTEPTGKEVANRFEFTDKRTLGTIEAGKIPAGYGVVTLNPEKSESLVTNNVGDVMLFIDPDTRSMSSMKLREVEWDAGGFVSGLGDLPREYQEAFRKAQMPKTFHVTDSPEGTEFVHAIGRGTTLDPLEIVQRSTHVYRDISLVHLAMAKHAAITKEPITVSLNDVLFTYTPNRDKVGLDVSVTFSPPREVGLIEKDLEQEKDISFLDHSYNQYLDEHPDTFKSPEDWYRQNYDGYGLNMAKAMFQNVGRRIKEKDF